MTLICIAVDDEPSSLEYIKRCCGEIKNINLKFTTTNPLEAKAYIENNPIDLLITDLNMSVLSGIDLNEAVKTKCKTIFVTGYTSFALDAMGKNAIEILMKPFSNITFEEAIEKARKIIDFDTTQNENDKLKKQFELLSETEKKILLEIGRGKRNKEIADDNCLSSNTVDTHKTNIKNKLGIKNSQKLLLFAYELLKIK